MIIELFLALGLQDGAKPTPKPKPKPQAEVRLLAGGIEAQTAQALANLEAILRARGADRRHVAKCTVFLTDMADFAGMNRAWIGFFGDTPPARSTIAAAGLALDAAIEVECIAERPASRSRP